MFLRFYWFIQERYMVLIAGFLGLVTTILVTSLFVTMWGSITSNVGTSKKNYDENFSKVVVLKKAAMKTGTEVTTEKPVLGDIVLDESKITVNDNAKAKSETTIDYAALQATVNEFYKPTTTETTTTPVQAVDTTPATVTPQGSLTLPSNADSSFKGYMCMHMVTAPSSAQYKFLHSGNYKFTTDPNGILKYNDYYVVAMGSYYTNYKVGSTFRITLDSGKVFDVITGDEKADVDTDSLHMYRPKSGGRAEIIEFVVACGDAGEKCTAFNPTLSAAASSAGSFNSLGFEGNVVKIEKLSDTSVSDAIN